MSPKRCKNPVNNHFIYNDETHKSTCKVCLFDMAGRHSENLMRHLKRKHPATYAEVMLEKQRRRSANANRSGSADTGPLSSMFKFETQPHKLFIKSEKLVFRLDEPGQPQMPVPEACPNDDDTSSGNGQFETLDIGKEELCEVVHSPDGLNDSSESYMYPDEDPFHATVGSHASTSSAPGQCNANALTHSQQAANDNASFLQYLNAKLSKYSLHTKYTIQYEINRILYKADMGCYDNADASKLPDLLP
ncbi:uncharacterized protein LOC6585279 isoform X1 [Drosophila mojavensis]|uniref:Uncharacterized protein, isoform B n=1 Tax=Drosophila mojavensis TaxID=7230 RepID=A0A0Q9XEQ6_DROMO|nr:uncharacterized protein LOC6585279 isoform X1 [Drosophila mojavensis]KRG07019.1 uncharacterized protein Dmoj_GI21444, isoform B [Drosophila mojavensis]